MQLIDIPNFSTVIAPTQMHRHIRTALLSGKVGRLGIKIASPRQFFSHPTISINDEDVFFQYKRILDEHYSVDCPNGIYKSVYKDLDFLKECKSFLDDCKLYGVPIQEFEEKSSELYDILVLLYPVLSDIDYVLEMQNKIQVENLFIIDTHYSAQERYLINSLMKYPHEMIQFDEFPIEGFYYALNKRQEIESVAQKIITNKIPAEDITVSLCDPNYEDVLHQVFNAYEIPHTILQKRSNSKIAQCMIDLLKFYYSKSNKDAIALLEAPWFYIENKSTYIEILEMFELDYDQELPFINSEKYKDTILDYNSVKFLEESIELARPAQIEFIEKLNPLLQDYSDEDVFATISEVLKDIATHLKSTDELYQIFDVLQKSEDLIKNESDRELLYELLESLTIKEPSIEQGVLVTPVQKALLPRSYHFILGAAQQNFPSFKTIKGIFREEFVEKSSYPSIEDRYELHVQSLSNSLLHSAHTYVSYSVGDYLGKANEASLEMEGLCKRFGLDKPQSYPLEQTHISYERNPKIGQLTARKLYLQENTLNASVSSFERFTSCPFAYYLRYGLRLKEQQSLSSLESNVVGNIYHKILEDSVDERSSEYASMSSEELLDGIKTQINFLNDLFPKRSKMYEVLEKRIFKSLSKSLLFLNDLQSESLYKDIKSEQKFTYEFDIDGVNVKLLGFIDRMDSNHKKAILIDYKSSARSLDEKQFLAGLQLQLTTYAWMVEELFGKEVIATLYFSFKEETLSTIASATNNRGKSPIKEFEEFEPMATSEDEFNTRKLRGWIYGKEIMDFDPSISHIYGIKNTKTKGITTDLYDLNLLKDVLKDLYKAITSSILDGEIAYEPVEGACAYCPYHSICRFNGQFRAVTSILDIEDLADYKMKSASLEGDVE